MFVPAGAPDYFGKSARRSSRGVSVMRITLDPHASLLDSLCKGGPLRVFCFQPRPVTPRNIQIEFPKKGFGPTVADQYCSCSRQNRNRNRNIRKVGLSQNDYFSLHDNLGLTVPLVSVKVADGLFLPRVTIASIDTKSWTNPPAPMETPRDPLDLSCSYPSLQPLKNKN